MDIYLCSEHNWRIFKLWWIWWIWCMAWGRGRLL